MQPIYLIVGVPGSGKTWVCEQVKDKFEYLPHDMFIEKDYMFEIALAAKGNTKPVLCETPFSINSLLIPLAEMGYSVEPVFIIEKPSVIMERYERREGKALPKGNLTRLETYKERAALMDAFQGTSAQVLEYLKNV